MKIVATRRQALGAALSVAAVSAVGCEAEDGELPPRAPFEGGIEEVVTLIETTPLEEVLDAVLDAVGDGMSVELLKTGAFLAAVAHVDPAPVGGAYHNVLVHRSLCNFSSDGPPHEALHAVLWGVLRVREHIDQIGAPGEISDPDAWILPPFDASALPDADEAAAAARSALDAFDAPAAEAALVALHRSSSKSAVTDLLLEYGCRRVRYLGHEGIIPATNVLLIDQLGWEHAEAVVRTAAISLVNQESFGGLSSAVDAIESWDQNRELSMEIPEGFEMGSLDPASAPGLAQLLRSASASDAAREVVDRLKAGMSPESIWSGILLAAGDEAVRTGDVHAVSAPSALRDGYYGAVSPEVRKLLLLQAASWVVLLREEHQRRGQIGPFSLELATVEPISGGNIETIFEALDDGLFAAGQRLLGFLEDGGSASALAAVLRTTAIRKAVEQHPFKYADALIREHGRTEAAWRNRLLALAVINTFSSSHPETDAWEQIAAALQRHGLPT